MRALQLRGAVFLHRSRWRVFHEPFARQATAVRGDISICGVNQQVEPTCLPARLCLRLRLCWALAVVTEAATLLSVLGTTQDGGTRCRLARYGRGQREGRDTCGGNSTVCRETQQAKHLRPNARQSAVGRSGGGGGNSDGAKC